MKSERDQIRAKQEQVMGSLVRGELPIPPPVVVGTITSEDLAYGSIDDVVAGDPVTIHNAEQIEVMALLAKLKSDCDAIIKDAADSAPTDENLYRQDVDWLLASCARAERWIDDEGGLGWRVQISGADRDAKRFFAYVEGNLRNRGWDSAVAEALR